eukprot:520448-Hanusia_phi.AAC.1
MDVTFQLPTTGYRTQHAEPESGACFWRPQAIQVKLNRPPRRAAFRSSGGGIRPSVAPGRSFQCFNTRLSSSLQWPDRRVPLRSPWPMARGTRSDHPVRAPSRRLVQRFEQPLNSRCRTVPPPGGAGSFSGADSRPGAGLSFRPKFPAFTARKLPQCGDDSESDLPVTVTGTVTRGGAGVSHGR